MDLAWHFKIPVYKLANEMPYDEYKAWAEYLRLNPPGRAEDYRAAVIVSALSQKAPIGKLFPSLASPEESVAVGNVNLAGSMMLTCLLNATGGDKIPL